VASKSSGSTPDLQILFADLVRTEVRLYNALNDGLRERHGIVTSQYEVLRYLRAHPGCRVADVAAELAVGVGATSKGIDRLEQRGWVARQPNPADRRSSLLVLTDEGVRLIDDAAPDVADLLASLAGGALGGDQLTALASALSVLRAALERDQVGVPVG